LDGVYRCGAEGKPVFVEVPAPTDEALQTVLHKIITRMMKLLIGKEVLVEEQCRTDMADDDSDSDEARQAAQAGLRDRHGAWPELRRSDEDHRGDRGTSSRNKRSSRKFSGTWDMHQRRKELGADLLHTGGGLGHHAGPERG
jgi:hypothetical protein